MPALDTDSPDYSNYTIDELKDVLNTIDKARFPKRYDNARTVLLHKIEQGKTKPTHNIDTAIPQLRQKPAGITLITIGLGVLFLLMIAASIPTFFVNFMVMKSWASSATMIAWLVAIIFTLMWILCLRLDVVFRTLLLRDIRGKLAIVFSPLLFTWISWMFVVKTLPLNLHFISSQQHVSHDVSYFKNSGTKRCSYRITVAETDTLESSDLCITKTQMNSLQERGQITIKGNRSQFAMIITEFHSL